MPPRPEEAAPATGAWGTPEAPPRPEPPPGLRAGWIVIGVVAVALVVLVLVLVMGGSALPDRFAGAERVTSGPIADMVSGMTDMIEEAGVSVDLALYGGELDPRYMVLTMEGAGVSGQDLTDQLQQGLPASVGGEIDLSEAIEESVDGVEYVCVPATGQQFAALGGNVGICLYQDGDQVAMTMSLRDDQLYGLMKETQALHDAIG